MNPLERPSFHSLSAQLLKLRKVEKSEDIEYMDTAQTDQHWDAMLDFYVK